MTPTFSIVIPAHDEAAVIERCLGAFLPWTGTGLPEVVVVANGCHDDTAERARTFVGVNVIELPTGSKRDALNAGDRLVTTMPRVYLDADVVLSGVGLEELKDCLDVDEPIAAAPSAHFVLDGRPWPVRAFYRVYRALPYVTDGLVGLGVVGLSRRGRERFGEFPDAIADDLYVQRLFAPHERTVLAGARFRVETPRTLRSLVVVRTRTAEGNAQLAGAAPGDTSFETTTRSTARALVRIVRQDPRLVLPATVYVLVTLAARWRAGRTDGSWQRDETTR